MTDGTPTKPCIKCGEVLPDTAEHFRTMRDRTIGTCRPCHRKALKEWRKANPDKYAAQRKRNYARNIRAGASFEENFKTLQESIPYYAFQYGRAYEFLKEHGFFDTVPK